MGGILIHLMSIKIHNSQHLPIRFIYLVFVCIPRWL